MPVADPHMTVDPAAWWRVKKKNSLFWNGYTRGYHHGSMALASALCVENADTANHVTGEFPDVQAFVESVQAPVWPSSFKTINQTMATAGQTVFNQNCASCHGTYATNPRNVAADTYPALLVNADAVGTDYVWARSGWMGNLTVMNSGVDSTAYAQVTSLAPWDGTFTPGVPAPFFNDTPPGPGYVAPPLDGLWASAPYLHNGSIPDMDSLLTPSHRPTYWTRNCEMQGIFHAQGDPVYCSKDLNQGNNTGGNNNFGFNYSSTLPPNLGGYGKYTYDTTVWSQGNGGHTYGSSLSQSDKNNLIEYLKQI
jgi:mono/diheme cytochrome c family protein